MSLDNEVTSPANAGVTIPGEGGGSDAAAPAVRSDAALDSSGDDTEQRARAMGWVPKEEFRGPAENWRDASEFVRKGEEDLPVMRERLRDTTRKLSALEQRLAERDQTFQNLERMTGIALQRQREQIEASYAAAQRQAVETGDTARFDQLRRDEQQALTNLDQQVYEARAPRQPQTMRGPAPDEVPIVQTWKQQNPWFLHDPEMNQVAQFRHMQLMRDRPELTLQQNLAETAKYVQQRYADRFGGNNTVRPSSMAVEGGSRVPSNGGPRRKGASDLPADARAQGEKFIKQGLFKDMAEYANDYFTQEGA